MTSSVLAPTLGPGTRECRITKESRKAMSVSVSMPQLGESVTEGTVTRWLKKEGERVEADEPLLEVSTDKVDTEIPSPVSGILRGITVAEDETVAVGAELAVIDETDGAGPAAQPGPEYAAPGQPPAAEHAAPPARPEYAQPSAGPELARPPAGPDHPPLPEPGYHPPAPGQAAPAAEYPPAAQPGYPPMQPAGEPPAPAGGYGPSLSPRRTRRRLRHRQHPRHRLPLAPARRRGAAAPPAVAAPRRPPQHRQPASARPPSTGRPEHRPRAPAPVTAPPPGAEGPYVTPLVRKLAAEHGVDLATVTGTGVGGRIRKQDVIEAARPAAGSRRPPPRQPAAAQAAGGPRRGAAPPARWRRRPRPGPSCPSTLRGTTERMSRARQVIAQRMVESLQTSAQLTTVVEADVTADRPAARPGQGRLRGPRGRQAVVPAVLRARRGRGAEGAPEAERGHRHRRRAR